MILIRTIALTVLIGALIVPVQVSSADPSPRTCSISDIVTLRACFGRPDEYDVFAFKANLRCTSDNDCCPGGHALMLFQGVSGKEIDGNSHIIRREAGQHACAVIAVRQSRGITVRSLSLDENGNVPACELSERTCPSTIDVASSNSIRIDDVRIYSGKGYVVKVWATTGFTFTHSVVSDAGIIGLYVGHYKFGVSRDITIADSVFVRTRTNAVALQGALSSDPAHPVLVANNVFADNHWHGLWPIPGGVTTGGQLYVGDGQNIHITGNIIAGHPCENCYRSQHVSGIEIGEIAPGPSGVHGLVIDHNIIVGTNEARFAIQQNPESNVSDVTISDCQMRGYDGLDNVTANTSRAHNTVDISRTSPPSVAAAGLVRSPRPEEPDSPEFLCVRKSDPAQNFTSMTKDCGGNGEIRAVLGFATPASQRP